MTTSQIAYVLATYQSKFFDAHMDHTQDDRVHISASHTEQPFYVIDILDVIDDNIVVDFKFCDPTGYIVNSTTEHMPSIQKIVQNIESDIRHSFGIY